MMTILSTPGTSIVAGLLVLLGITIATRTRTRRRTAAEGQPSNRFARRAAWAVLIPFLVAETLPYVDLLLRYTAPDAAAAFLRVVPWEARWWLVFLGPLAAAVVCIDIALVLVAKRTAPPEVPVVPVLRRGWTTFARRRDLLVAGAVALLLAVTTVIAGAVSSPDERGWYTWLEVPAGGGNSASTFFGWAYGIPVLVLAALLGGLTYAVLRTDAIRPFSRPDTVDSESALRRDTAAVVLRIATAAITLVLGTALVLIGGAGSGSSGVDVPGVGTFTFTSGYSAIAPTIIAIGWLLQAAAVVLLLRPVRTGAAA